MASKKLRPDILTTAEIRRFLMKLRYDPEMSRGAGDHWREIPLQALSNVAQLGGYGPNHFKMIISGQRANMKTRRALTPLIRQIESGELKIRNKPIHRGYGALGFRGVETVVEYASPPSRPGPPVPKLVPADSWRPFARCLSCGGLAWKSIVIRGGSFYACNSCCGPAHWPAMGGRRTTKAERAGLPETQMVEDFSLESR